MCIINSWISDINKLMMLEIPKQEADYIIINYTKVFGPKDTDFKRMYNCFAQNCNSTSPRKQYYKSKYYILQKSNISRQWRQI